MARQQCRGAGGRGGWKTPRDKLRAGNDKGFAREGSAKQNAMK